MPMQPGNVAEMRPVRREEMPGAAVNTRFAHSAAISLSPGRVTDEWERLSRAGPRVDSGAECLAALDPMRIPPPRA